MSRAPFPFIVGCPRSGTTLLRAMFDSHPEMAIPPEAQFIVPMLRLRRRYESSRGIRTDALVAALKPAAQFPGWGLPEETVREAIGSSGGLPEALRRLHAAYAARDGKPRYGDKTPGAVLGIDVIAAAFPEARFIHVFRDGRDVGLSLITQSFGPSRIGRAALWWRRRVRGGRRSGRRLGPTRYMEVRYETLVSDPEPIVRSLAEFAGLRFRDEMLRYHERGGPLRGVSSAAHARLHLPPTAGLRDWRSQMAPGDVVQFELLAGDLLEELGYERGSVSSMGTRLHARAKRAAWASRRAASRTRKVVGRLGRAMAAR